MSEFVPFKNWHYSNATYINRAREESQIASRLFRPHFRQCWEVTISIRKHLSADEHKKWFKNFSKNIRGKVVMYYVREFKDGWHWGNTYQEVHLHYHCIVKVNSNAVIASFADHSRSKLSVKQILRSALPKEHREQIEVWVDKAPFENVRHLTNYTRYILKAKVAGCDENGIYREDKHRHKRFLFPKSCPLDKIGMVGELPINKTQVKKQIADERDKRNELILSATQDDKKQAEILSRWLDIEFENAIWHIVKHKANSNAVIASFDNEITPVDEHSIDPDTSNQPQETPNLSPSYIPFCSNPWESVSNSYFPTGDLEKLKISDVKVSLIHHDGMLDDKGRTNRCNTCSDKSINVLSR